MHGWRKAGAWCGHATGGASSVTTWAAMPLYLGAGVGGWHVPKKGYAYSA